MANLDNPKRYRLTVPAQDTSVQDWIAAQLNISASIRQLIRKDIQSNGYTDVTCRQVEQGAKRGRPSNAELERREAESQFVSDPVTNSNLHETPIPKKQPVQTASPLQTVIPDQTESVPKNDPAKFMLGSSPTGQQPPGQPAEKENDPDLGLGTMLDSIMA